MEDVEDGRKRAPTVFTKCGPELDGGEVLKKPLELELGQLRLPPAARLFVQPGHEKKMRFDTMKQEVCCLTYFILFSVVQHSMTCRTLLLLIPETVADFLSTGDDRLQVIQ